MLFVSSATISPIAIDDHELKCAHTFTYVGGNMSDDATLDSEIQ